MQVKDLMTTGISCVEEKAPLSQIARQMRQEDVGVIPVCNDKGEVLGIVTDRDLVIRALAREGDGKPSAELKAGDIMSTGLVCASFHLRRLRAYPSILKLISRFSMSTESTWIRTLCPKP